MLRTVLVASWCLIALEVEGNVNREDSRLVNTAQGPVRGYRGPYTDIIEFYNIPYATAPTGINKFKAPLPPPVWAEPFEAVDTGIICPQNIMGTMLAPNGTVLEDCLVANVYVPDTVERNLSVLVVVHGGGFQIGYGDMMKPRNLIRTKNIIVVNFNYRLGIHGFLCLGTETAPGNAGIKDQVALLRWVRTNIAAFGGNPNDVTISGFSAGSASVDLLMLSKATRGLFNKVIPESGSHLSGFCMQTDPIENAKYFSRRFNFTEDDMTALENFYTSASFEVLTVDMFADRPDGDVVFSPCVERDLGDEVFLDESPFNILKSGNYEKMPMLHGFADMEGLLHINLFELWKHRMNEKFSDFIPSDLQFESEEQRERMASTIKAFYFGDQPVSNDNVLKYIDYFTDTGFAFPTLKSIKMQVESGHDQIYLYEYSFVDNDTVPVPHTDVRGADHTAQTVAVFDSRNVTSSVDESILSEEYQKMKLIMRELWSNFITTGKPVPEGSNLPAWPPVNATWSPHMSLAQTVELRGSLLEARVRFWDDIYEQHYRNPVPPHATDSAPVHKNIWFINFIFVSFLFAWK